MFRDKIREILELVLKAEEKNIYVAYNYDTNTKTLTIITKTKVFAFEDNEYIEKMVGRMHSVSQKSDRGENRMTEEERMREVERISRRTKELVKIPSDQQRTIRIVRFRNKTLASYVGTMEEALQRAKEMEGLYGPIEHIE